MKTINSILLALGVATVLVSQSCVKEKIYPIPMVELNVSFEKPIQSQVKATAASSVCFYLYPNFDYQADPIVVSSNSTNLQVPLLPGDYGVLVHNSPIDPVVVSGAEQMENLTLTLPKSADGFLMSCPTVYALKETDAMRKITISRDEPNSFLFKPVVISKRIRFVLNVDNKFGNVTSARATLSGVATEVNLSTLKANKGLTLSIAEFQVVGSRLSSYNCEMLGFTTENEPVTLTLFAHNDQVSHELEQPIDLTDYLKDLVGDEIEITISVSYNPDIRLHPVSIRQWQDGNDLEIDVK